jgi:hypothetical protein
MKILLIAIYIILSLSFYDCNQNSYNNTHNNVVVDTSITRRCTNENCLLKTNIKINEV